MKYQTITSKMIFEEISDMLKEGHSLKDVLDLYHKVKELQIWMRNMKHALTREED